MGMIELLILGLLAYFFFGLPSLMIAIVVGGFIGFALFATF